RFRLAKMDDQRERVDKPFHVWMMISSDKFSFRWDHILRTGGSVECSGRRVLSSFKRAGEGDRIHCYQTGVREKGLVGIGWGVHPMCQGMHDMEIERITRVQRTVPYEWFRLLREYRATQASTLRHRGPLCSLTDPFVRLVRELMEEMGGLRGARLLGGEAAR